MYAYYTSHARRNPLAAPITRTIAKSCGVTYRLVLNLLEDEPLDTGTRLDKRTTNRFCYLLWTLQSSCPITLRFAVALSAISESEGSASEQGNHYLNSPIYQDTGCNLFHSCPLSACKDDLQHNDLRRELRLLQNFQTAAQAAASGR